MLCSKVLKLDHVMSIIVSIVNCLRTRRLKQRLFVSFFEEAGAGYGDVVYHTDVRWLSHAKVLKWFIALKDEIISVFKTQLQKFPELNVSCWNEDLFFFATILHI